MHITSDMISWNIFIYVEVCESEDTGLEENSHADRWKRIMYRNKLNIINWIIIEKHCFSISNRNGFPKTMF